MVKALLDTNILIDYLCGITQAKAEIARYDDAAISVITWMEVMVGATAENHEATRTFLRQFQIIALDDAIAQTAVDIRKANRLRLPDAVIWASARTQDRLLVTRNTRDFPVDDPGVREPYRLQPGAA